MDESLKFDYRIWCVITQGLTKLEKAAPFTGSKSQDSLGRKIRQDVLSQVIMASSFERGSKYGFFSVQEKIREE